MAFRHHIFFCENARNEGDARGSCTIRGGPALRAHAKERCHQLGLKGQVRVNAAGCLDRCAYGPAVVVYGEADPPGGVWYTVRTLAEVDRIIDEHLVNDQPVPDLKMPDFKKPDG